MVCGKCRMAAWAAHERTVIYQHLNGKEQEDLPGPEAAARIHAGCPGGTWCDCQHKVAAPTRM